MSGYSSLWTGGDFCWAYQEGAGWGLCVHQEPKPEQGRWAPRVTCLVQAGEQVSKTACSSCGFSAVPFMTTIVQSGGPLEMVPDGGGLTQRGYQMHSLLKEFTLWVPEVACPPTLTQSVSVLSILHCHLSFWFCSSSPLLLPLQEAPFLSQHFWTEPAKLNVPTPPTSPLFPTLC